MARYTAGTHCMVRLHTTVTWRTTRKEQCCCFSIATKSDNILDETIAWESLEKGDSQGSRMNGLKSGAVNAGRRRRGL